jgi:hypothetical protein
MLTTNEIKKTIIFDNFNETKKPVQITFIKKNGEPRTMTILKNQELIDQLIGCPNAKKATETMEKNNMYRVIELLIEDGEMRHQWRVINIDTITSIKVDGNCYQFAL